MSLTLLCCIVAGMYGFALLRYRHRIQRAWPIWRTVCFLGGIVSGWLALASPLDAAGDERFTPHMLQHLILTDVTAPLLLVGGPLLLLLGALPQSQGKRVSTFLKSRFVHLVTSPICTWSVFILSLWIIHFSRFFEAALESEPLHLLEHAIFLTTAMLFWLPILPAGPMPYNMGSLTYPFRLLYLLIAMPAEAFLGLAIYSERSVLYRHYQAAGLGDQQAAGELMWIGSGLVMFVAFMGVAYEWARREAL